MNVIERVQQLKDNGTSGKEIERMLLNGELGEIGVSNIGYQHIEQYQLSHLIVEAYHSGFLKCSM